MIPTLGLKPSGSIKATSRKRGLRPIFHIRRRMGNLGPVDFSLENDLTD